MARPESTETASAERSSFQAPTISLPKGGGAIRGIGEKFAANPVTGTGSMSVPIATSPGRSGFGPQLSLSYDSGSGNGPFGFGWSLSLPSITRKTDKGLPQYRDAEGSDVFILSGSEDLVPLFRRNDDGSWVVDEDGHHVIHEDPRDGFTVRRFRPRIEGLFARIERWTNGVTGEVSWRSISRDNITTWYGRTAESRIADPADPTRVFCWLICQSYDDKGNAIVYEYEEENGAGVDAGLANERHRARTANRYLKRIRYGNHDPNRDPATWNAFDPSTLDENGWMFEVVFDYGEHDKNAPMPNDAGEWTHRVDAFSSYRSGFEVRTSRLCRRVLMFHHFPGEPGVDRDCLVRSTDFAYSTDGNPAPDPLTSVEPVYSFLRSVTQWGYRRQGNQYSPRSMPPLEFTYSEPRVRPEVEEVDAESLANLPAGLDGSSYQWTDLHGEGIQGILTEQAGEWFYKRNLSPIIDRPENGNGHVTARFAPLELVATKPNLSLTEGEAQFLDLAGDGQPDVVVFEGPTPGLYEHDDEESWQPFRAFAHRLNRDTRDPNLKFVDLDGDGHADALITEGDALVWHRSRAEEGFEPARRVHQELDEEKGPRLVFADGTQSIYLADMSGDGLSDFVRIRNGDVSYWPNLGYGRFGAKVAMDNAPVFDHPDQFDQRRIRLADIDGSGTTDIIYLHRDGVRLHFNQSGNGWSRPPALPAFPAIDSITSVTPIDLLGNGTACLVWSSPLPGDAGRQMRYVNLIGTQKPHLLIGVANNLGAETHVEYAPSTKFYLADKRDGKPWATRLPFPVHVVERVITYDWISRNRFVTRYDYHHGYFDGAEREFRGFGMVEQQDTERLGALTADNSFPDVSNIDAASHVPPVVTKTWYHTGAWLRGEHIERRLAREYFGAPTDAAAFEAWARDHLLPDTVLPDVPLAADEERQAVRALKGAMLRQEVYAQDGGLKAALPYTVTEQNFAIKQLQPQEKNRHAVFFTHARETLTYHYERNLADPRIGHELTLETDDFGTVLKTASIGYGRGAGGAELTEQWDRDQQTTTLVTFTENEPTNAIRDPDDHRTPLPAESITYQLSGYTGSGPAGRFQASDFVQPDLDPTRPGRLALIVDSEIAYEGAPTGDKQRRPIERVRTYYRPDDLGKAAGDALALLGLTEVQPLALPGETYKLAYTPGLVTDAFSSRVTDEMLSEGGYGHPDGDAGWWIPSGRIFYSKERADDAPAEELAHARSHFFLPHRYRDPFDTKGAPTETLVDYDAYQLLVVETRDPLLNVVTSLTEDENAPTIADRKRVRNDYRVLQPFWMTDPNSNRTRVAFDALGLVMRTAVMGKAEEGKGDALDRVENDLTEAEIAGFFSAADPHGPGEALLKHATTLVVYDVNRFLRTKRASEDRKTWEPAFAATIARETHVSDGGVPPNLKVQISFSYSDGFGREIQKKIQAESGPGPTRDAAGEIVFGPDRHPVPTDGDVKPRWVGSGWTVFNNKGKPVRQYEPFFTDRHRFEFNVRIGVSPILFYDPVERVVVTLHPNHTYEKVVFDPWRQATYDVNDTVAPRAPQTGDPRTDPDVADLVREYFKTEPGWKTWHALRITRPVGDPERSAAEKAAAHADTPTVAHFDALGRTFLTLAHNGYKDGAPIQYPTRVRLDIEGNQREVRDAVVKTVGPDDPLGRVVMLYDYDMLGNRVHQASMEAGERWTLNDVRGKAIRAWDSRGHAFETRYDRLRRVVGQHVEGTSGASDPRTLNKRIQFQTIEYGDAVPTDPTANLRTRVWRQGDGAGLVTNSEYDFKGNLLRTSRELAQDYQMIPDWSGGPALEAPLTLSTTYDALNRPITVTTPDKSVRRNSYNAANLLEAVDVDLHGTGVPRAFVTDIDYDAKGQRTEIKYATEDGSGIRTRYTYDRETFRLTHLTTRRLGAHFDTTDRPGEVQNLHYAYDPGGNITSIRDDAQPSIYFNGSVAQPHCEYTYDAIYRVTEATGREHIGLSTHPETSWNDHPRARQPHPHDGTQMRPYTETYDYDPVGNILAFQHVAAGGNWTRSHMYDEPSLLEPTTKKNNRLSSTTVGHDNDTDGTYLHDAHGNIVRMRHLSPPTDLTSANMHWDFQDRLRHINKNDNGIVYYVYDAAGQRVRKRWDNGGMQEERIYIGDYEVFRRPISGGAMLVRETLHVRDDRQRIALVETRTQGIEPGVPQQLIRYQFSNPLGTASLELAYDAQVISYEEYYPYGCTSYQGVRNQVEIPKRYRYTGTERDEESGFYAHGARLYAPWLARWTGPDPAGLIDGSNLYIYVRDNPIMYRDRLGRYAEAGHYYTSFAVALASGFSPRMAQRIAFFSQMPDEVSDMDAIAVQVDALRGQPEGAVQRVGDTLRQARNAIRGIGGGEGPGVVVPPFSPLTQPSTSDEFSGPIRTSIQQGYHSLTGREGVTESAFRAAVLAKLDAKTPEFGWAVHAFGDSFSHRELSSGKLFGVLPIDVSGNPDQTYATGFGHAKHGTTPDDIAVRGKLYAEYVDALASVFTSKTGASLSKTSASLQRLVKDVQGARSEGERVAILKSYISAKLKNSAERTQLLKYAPEKLGHVPLNEFQKSEAYVEQKAHVGFKEIFDAAADVNREGTRYFKNPN